MINSVNTLEFLKPKLLSMDKLNTANSTTRRTHPHQLFTTRNFYNIVGGGSGDHQTAQEQPKQERVKVQLLENHTKLQNNDCWNNICNLLSPSKYQKMADEEEDHQKQQQEIDNDTTDANIETKSAFNLDLNNRKITYSNINSNNNNSNNNAKSSHPIAETNNNDLFYKQHQNGFINKEQPQQKTLMVLLPQRTEDQEHAHRRIEIVHNYAKLKSYEDESGDSQSPNGSRNSSYLDDEEDDDDDAEDDYEDYDDNNDADYDAEEDDEMIDLDGDYEDIFKRRKFSKLSKQPSVDGAFSRIITNQQQQQHHMSNSTTTTTAATNNNKRCHKSMTSQKHHTATTKSHSDEDTDIHVDVDVETLDNQINQTLKTVAAAAAGNCAIASCGDSVMSKPDHHARRPMNAFLIFCKRHRAIVKERYKNLENRAITKILGDWWASLDVNDKKCFTNLAQQNKDAFFSANPNFKWYKLPAPPLRTLNTRPNIVGEVTDDMLEHDNYHNMTIENSNHPTAAAGVVNSRNYFKLADEAQMGDLSQLMQNKSGTQQFALQQALGETSQFIRSHITGHADDSEVGASQRKQLALKRPLYNENSFSSNSSEEDASIPKKKSSRSCKGKIYQELINSGQIAAPAIKRSKSMQRVVASESTSQQQQHRYTTETTNQMVMPNNNASMPQMEKQKTFETSSSTQEENNTNSHEMASFDLEEKIKELPALSLDEYLQRKRNTKKKKKFTSGGKKRNGGNKATSAKKQTPISPTSDTLDARIIQQRKQQQQAVGSQKRKARKESITRRDVSAIEEEVASLMPIAIINSFGRCCYFEDASSITSLYKNDMTKDISNPATISSNNIVKYPLEIIIPTATIKEEVKEEEMSPNSTELLTNYNNNNNTLNDNISPTSDLLILAEVAANRTE
ncbi:bobby sox [Musca autumnalis]|uniref:bobby sox n=1 Tax=Musca autumnalis TaxID=221902 RepID=UPI003CF8A0B6